MTRWIGGALLAVGCGALGVTAVWLMDCRVRDLRGMIAGLYAMERALSASLAPLCEMLSAAAEGTEGRPSRFFGACGAEMSASGRQFGGVWASALETAALCLDGGDTDMLRSLGGVLGRYDAANQSAAILRTASGLEDRLAEASERRGRLGRVYGTLGVSAGLFLVILLF